VLGVAVRFGVARYPRGLAEWRIVTVAALIQNVVPFAFLAWGEERVTSSLASVLNASTPLWTAAFAAAFLAGERLDLRRAVGLLLGITGVVLIAEPWRAGGGHVLGEVACLGAAAMYGVGFVYTSRFISGKVPPMTAAVGQVTSGAIVATAIALVTTATSSSATHVDPHIVASMLTLGAVGTGLAYIMFFDLIETAGPTVASTVTFATPFVGVLLGLIVLGERVGWNVAYGGAIAIAGILAVRRRIAVAEPAEVGA